MADGDNGPVRMVEQIMTTLDGQTVTVPARGNRVPGGHANEAWL